LIETNFLAGRTFSGWEDLNQQARQWCDKVNSTYKKHLRAIPRELFAVERPQLRSSMTRRSTVSGLQTPIVEKRRVTPRKTS
jgi:hypothetical protein